MASVNDYRPVQPSHHHAMNVLERLVLRHLVCTIRGKMDYHQFAYQASRSVGRRCCLALHLIYRHFKFSGSYSGILFVDYSPALSAIIPWKIFDSLSPLVPPSPQSVSL